MESTATDTHSHAHCNPRRTNMQAIDLAGKRGRKWDPFQLALTGMIVQAVRALDSPLSILSRLVRRRLPCRRLFPSSVRAKPTTTVNLTSECRGLT